MSEKNTEIKKNDDAIKDSIISDNLKELAKESSEIILDSILEDGLLKEIPFVSFITGIVKTGFNIKNSNTKFQKLEMFCYLF